ncbi:hypothetical protein NUW58_g10103 [Xylaria curta]|uniref:Uncharacterized protein n=1 Tax=Xylaria curta TaxID=42375 RepID=A0ACC1MPM1_9PEZI|nr:hypothetical protein NUW58_g10103 [Xylaria curta]
MTRDVTGPQRYAQIIYATSEERKQRNRQAQAAFRERRTEYIKQLEDTIRVHESNLTNLQAAHRSAAEECLMLRYKNSLLERILLEKGIDVQAELQAKTGSPNLGPTHMPQNMVQPPPIQRAVLNRHHNSRRSASSIAPKLEPGITSVPAQVNIQPSVASPRGNSCFARSADRSLSGATAARSQLPRPGDEADLDKSHRTRDTLTYRSDDQAPLGSSDDDYSQSDDDEPPEATGQIKVAMFRVIASGEIKKGEYSPQFDAHDDDDDSDGANKDGNNGTMTLTTQTVTGIDGPDKPYAVFTFFYRGQKDAGHQATIDVGLLGLGPLKSTGTVGFSAFRDQETEAAQRRKARRKSNGNAVGAMDDSDDDDDEENPLARMEDVEDKVVKSHLGPEDARLKRQHSAEPESAGSSQRKSPSSGPNGGDATPPETTQPDRPAPDTAPSLLSQAFTAESTIGSPMKKQRANADGATEDRSVNFPSALGDVLGRATAGQKTKEPVPTVQITEDEEL